MLQKALYSSCDLATHNYMGCAPLLLALKSPTCQQGGSPYAHMYRGPDVRPDTSVMLLC